MYYKSAILSVLSHKEMFSEPSSPTPILFQFQYDNDQRVRDRCCFLYWWGQIFFLGSNWYLDWLISWTHIFILYFTSLPAPHTDTDPHSCLQNRYDLKSKDILDQHIPKDKTGASHSVVQENLKEKRVNKNEAREDTKDQPHAWLGLTAATEAGLPLAAWKQAISPWAAHWMTGDTAFQFSLFIWLV